MNKHYLAPLAVVFCILLPAAAQASGAAPDGLPGQVETNMHFLGGVWRFDHSGFAVPGKASAGTKSLTEPFGAAPYTGATTRGVGYDFRLVLSHVRMTLGVDVPFPSFDSRSTAATYTLDGTPTKIVPQAIHAVALRFGLGSELPIRRFALFADLYGTTTYVTTDLSVGGQAAHLSAVDFGFSVSAGARFDIRKGFFVFASGEYGLGSDVVWDARAGVGMVLGSWS